MNKEKFQFICGVFSIGIGYLIGEFDTPFRILLILIITDIIVGVTDVIFFGITKYGKKFSSEGLMQGAIRKGLMLAIIVIATQLDNLLDFNYIRTGAVMYLITTEGISIIENLIKIGVPCPTFLRNILEVVNEEVNENGKRD